MNSPEALTELQLRVALRTHLDAHGRGGIVIEEMALERGVARIDLALVGERLLGFEIKSDLDGPERFVNQIHAYNRVFDEISLVCSKRAAGVFERLLPSWWGIFAAVPYSSGFVLQPHRPPRPNERREAMSLALLLRQDEILQVFSRHLRDAPPSRANKTQLQNLLATTLSVAQLGSIVIDALRTRQLTNSPAL